MEIARVDLRGLEHGGPGWGKAREAVTGSMVAHGCVVVAHDALGPELRQELFGRAMAEFITLPVEAKQRNLPSMGPNGGYTSNVRHLNWESLRISDPTDAGRVREIAGLMWPQQGNPAFCDTIVSAARNMVPLLQTVEKMVLEGLGVQEEHIQAHVDTLLHDIRMSSYGVPLDTVNAVSLPAHRDGDMITTIVQHEVEGLEVQAKDGSWLAVQPEEGTSIFMAGDMFALVTNGRVPSCLHRVRTPSNRDRLSVLFVSKGKEGVLLSAMDELVDDDHPLVYHPCTHDGYIKFRFSAQGMKSSDPLKAFCGVDKDGLPTE